MTISPSFTIEKPLRIGTRRSPLALAQAQLAVHAIAEAHGLNDAAIQLVPMLSSGDRVQDRPLAELGGKALWTKELERAMLSGEIDMAVHSMKDVETERPEVFQIAAMLPRADVRDRLIGAATISALNHGANIGTSSPRRGAQLLAIRPDLRIASIRGNVATRLGQVESGVFDGTLLAAAGLDRLSYSNTGTAICVDDMLPAASQGAIGLDTISSRPDMLAFLQRLNHADTFVCVMAERTFLAALGGSCHSPVAALAVITDEKIWLRGEILREDGSERQSGDIRFGASDTEAPAALAKDLLSKASSSLAAMFAP